MKICLIIINYNGYNFLKSHLEDIFTISSTNNIDIVITDDRSTDSSIAYLKEKNYEYTINNSDNKGFASNVNNGIRYAKAKKDYDFYIISNNDIKIREELFEGTMARAIKTITDADPLTGLIGFDEILIDKKSYFENYDFNKYDGPQLTPLQHIPGFFFLVRKNLVEKIGYFDEEYFMYGEDNDYFTRTLKGGFKIYNTNLPVMHYSEGASSNSKLTSWYAYRNAFLYAQKNLGIFAFIKLFISFINIIYNPFYKHSQPSSMRVKRNGFFYNNYLLIKSLIWNLKYYIKKNDKRFS